MIDALIFIVGLFEIISICRFIVAFGLFVIPAFLSFHFQLAGDYSNLLVILFLCLGITSGWIWQVKHERKKPGSKVGQPRPPRNHNHPT
jgi:hypothetical protein